MKGDATQARMTVEEFRATVGKNVDEIVRTSTVGSAAISKAMTEANVKATAASNQATKAQAAAVASQVKTEEDHAKKLIAQINAQTAGSKAYTEKYLADSQNVIKSAQQVEQNAVRATAHLNAETEKTVQSTQGLGTAMADIAGPVAIAAGVIAAITSAAIAAGVELFNLAKGAADYGDQIYKAAVKTGLSTEFLSVAKVRVDETGGSFQNFTQGLARFEIALSKSLSNPTGEAAKAFDVLHLKVDELKAALPDDRILMVGQALAKVTDVAERNRIAVALGSRGFLEQIGTLEALTTHYDELHAKTEALGLLWSGEMAQKAHNFNIQVADLDLKAKGFAITVGEKLIPEFSNLASFVDNATKSTGGFANMIGKTLATEVKLTTNALQAFLAMFKTYTDIATNPKVLGTFTLNGLYLNNFRALNPQQDSTRLTSGDRDSFAGVDRNSTEFEGKTKKPKVESASTELERRLALIKDGEEKIRAEYQKSQDAEQELFDKNNTSRAAYTETQKTLLETELTQLRINLDTQALLITNSPIAEDLKAKKLSDIQKQIDKARADTDHKKHVLDTARDKEEEQTDKEHRARMLQLQEESGNAIIALIQREADRRTITYSDAQAKIEAIQRESLKSELDGLRVRLARAGQNEKERSKALDDFAAYYLKLTDFDNAAVAAHTDSREKDLQIERTYNDELRKRHAEEDQLNIAHELSLLGTFNARTMTYYQYLVKEQALHLKKEEADHEAFLKQLDADEAAEIEADKTGKRRLEIEKYYNALRRAENDRFADDQKRKQRNKNIELANAAHPGGAGFLQGLTSGVSAIGNLKDETTGAAKGIVSMSDALTTLGQVGGAVVDGLAQGVGQLVSNFVLMGSQGPHAMRKLVASVLAGVAAQAAVQAVMFTAYGLAALTPWGAAIYGPASQWFIAAALMASIATVTGLAGRAVAGDLFKNQSSSSGSGSNAQSGQAGQTNYTYGSSQQSASQAQGGLVPILKQTADTQLRMVQVLDDHTQVLSRLNSIPHGEALAMGAAQNPAAVGQAVLVHQRSNNDFSDSLLTNAGFR